MSAWMRVMALEERLNPVLVKEVRQSLRGKQFRGAFGLTLILSLVVAITLVLNNAEDAAWDPIGPVFLTGVFSCLAVAVVGFVPLAAFNAMGAEFDENTYDMLILSHLRPRQILLGKLLAAGVQALLYFSVFGFFVVFAFLLGGVDLMLLLVSMPLLAVVSLGLSSLAIGLSTLSQKRTTRVLLMVLLSAVLVGSVIGAIGMQMSATQFGLDLSDADTQMGITSLLVAALILGSLSFAIGAARLAHEEENRSTGLRVLGFVIVLCILGWGVWMSDRIGHAEPLALVSMLGITLATLMATFFATERESLGRRVATILPRSRFVRLLLLPWLPGGGRGAMWLLGIHLVVLGVVFTSIGASPTSSMGGKSTMQIQQGLLVVCSYSVIYVLLPAVLFNNRTRRLHRSTLARVAVIVFFVLGMLVPMVLGFLSGNGDLASGEHFGVPFWVLDETFSKDDFDASPLFLVAGLVILLHVLRFARALREVLSVPKRG